MKLLHLRPKVLSFNAGFTMVEVLVVISILAILATVGVSSYTLVQRNNRDQQRFRELNVIKQALELYRNDQGYYPLTSSFPASGSPLTSPDTSKTYLSATPGDMITDRNYAYLGQDCSGSQCLNYTVCASQEGTGSFSLPSDCSSASCGSTVCSMGLTSD